MKQKPTPKQKRYSLRRLLEALRDAPEEKPLPRQDRGTAERVAELERELDRALRSEE